MALKIHIENTESVYVGGFGKIRDINLLCVFPVVIPKANIRPNHKCVFQVSALKN